MSSVTVKWAFFSLRSSLTLSPKQSISVMALMSLSLSRREEFLMYVTRCLICSCERTLLSTLVRREVLLRLLCLKPVKGLFSIKPLSVR